MPSYFSKYVYSEESAVNRFLYEDVVTVKRGSAGWALSILFKSSYIELNKVEQLSFIYPHFT
jgi:hypothetical protein